MEDREQIIEEVKRRINALNAARSATRHPLDRESIGALSELNDLLEWLEA